MERVLEPAIAPARRAARFSGNSRPGPAKRSVALTRARTVRRGDLLKTELTAKGSDQGYSFMLVEIAGDELYFQAISQQGQTIDDGVIRRVEKKIPVAAARAPSSR